MSAQSTELLVKISVQDDASPEFKRIGQTARTMGTEVQKAGNSGRSAMQGIRNLAQQSAVGVGLVSGSFGLFARAVRDADRDLMTLERTYGTTASSLREFADELQRTTTYSNEQAIGAANVFGTLARNYGMTADQIQELITISADLAAVNGITLEDAAQRVQAALRGEAESAEALGLTMNETAIGLDKVSAGMSESEKAAYRYDALLKQAAFATGAAGEQAQTTSGQFTQLTNRLQDAGQDFVRFTGPVGQAVAGLSDMSLEVGMAASGFAAMAPVVRTAVTAVGGLATAMGPVGLALAAGAAILGIVGLSQATSDYGKSAEEAQNATASLMTEIENVALGADTGSQLQKDAEFIQSSLQTLSGGLTTTRDAALDAELAIRFAQQSLNLYGDAATDVETVLALLDESQQAAIQGTEAWAAAAENGEITGRELDDVLTELGSEYEYLGDGAGTATDAVNLANEVLARAEDQGVNTEQVYRDVADAFRRFAETGDFEQLIADLALVESGLNDVNLTATKVNQTVLDMQQIMTDAWTGAMDPLTGVEDLLVGIFSSMAPGAYEAQQAINGVTGSADRLSVALANTAGNPIAQQAAIDAFYESASAIEILNYELALAGDNQELINIAFANFATRVREADSEVNRLARSTSNAWKASASTWGSMATANQTAIETTKEAEVAAREAAEAAHAWGEAWRTAATGWGTMAAGNIAVANGATENLAVSIEDQAAAALDAAGAMGVLNDSLQIFAAAGVGTEWTAGTTIIETARNATNAVNALETGFNALIQGPAGWGRQAAAVHEWAKELINVEGVWGKIDNLIAENRISTEEYEAAQTSYNRIAAVQYEVQQDIATIQAKQAPVIADLVEAQAKYIDQIAGMDAEQATVALGFMDTTKAAQAQNAVMLAASAAAGEYGAAGMEFATQIITGMAMADPVLAGMLENIGLITTDHEGNVTVNFPNARTIQDAIDDLTASVNALTRALGGIPPVTDAAVRVSYTVNGQAVRPGGTWGFTEFQTGGTVTHRVASAMPAYATAQTGRTVLVGEAGPELVSLPTGSQVTNAVASADRMTRRTAGAAGGGGVYFYGPVTLAPASVDIEDAIRREAMSGSRGY